MRFGTTTLLLAAISIHLHFTLAFSSSSYSRGRRTLDELLPVGGTSESTPQTTVTTSTDLTSTNVTFVPWPRLPINIPLSSGNFTLSIRFASEWNTHPPINLVDLMDFITAFRDNLDEKYPGPAFAPRRAISTYVDMTFTRWIIEFDRSLLGKEIPIAVLLESLDEYNVLLRRHGPASISSPIFSGTSRVFWSATLFLFIEYLAGSPLNVSSPSENYDFTTS